MSKVLDALEKLIDRANHDEYVFRGDTNIEKAQKFLDENNEYKETIEKELKEKEENEKVLNVFKNALTIEHHDLSMVVPQDDNEDIVAYAFKTLTTIRQNELDKSLRKALREWVLKNAFPKELKDLEFIKKCFYVSSSGGVFKTDFGDENIDKLKEVLL